MSEPTAKKIRGEGHWYPAVKTVAGPEPIVFERFSSAHAATKEAKRILDAKAAAQKEHHHGND